MSGPSDDRRSPRALSPRGPEEAASLEVEHHLAELADRLAREGMDPERARLEAERRFGDPGRYRASLERTEKRRRTMRRRIEAWDLMAGGTARALRSVRRHPGFTAGVVLTLALGLGANAAMFGILDRLLFQPPLHVEAPEEVVRVMVVRPFGERITRQSSITFPDYLDLKAHGGFSAVAAWSGPYPQTVGSGPGASRLRATQASHELFPLLGVRPELGRFYGPDEDRIGAMPTVVVSHEYWRGTLASDPAVLDRALVISGTTYSIIGVAPEGFTGVDLSPVDAWVPLETSQAIVNGEGWRDSRGWFWMEAVARLAEGATVESAAAEATALHLNGRRQGVEQGNYPTSAHVALDPLNPARGPEAPPESKVAGWLGGVSLIVLLIACANVANLLLARGTLRRREVAVRLAVGVDRRHLISQMVLESVLLALFGGGIALLIAFWGGSLVRAILLPGVYFPGSAVDGRVVLFTLGASVFAGVLAGLGPALQASRADISSHLAMGAGSGSGRRSRARALLTVSQAALSTVLLVGAGLFVKSVAEVRSLDLGLDVGELLLATLEFEDASVVATEGEAPSGSSNEASFQAMERLREMPGVVAVAGTSAPFLWANAMSLEVPGLDSIPGMPGGGPYFQTVTPGYFETVGLRLVQGRTLQDADDAGAAPVTVISETMARSLWPGEEALGRVLLVDKQKEPFTVVGVVEDASRGSIRENPYMAYYLSIAQWEKQPLSGWYIRASGDPEEVGPRVSQMLRSVDPRIRYATVGSLRGILEPQTRSWTLGAAMFSVFGILALAVAAIGLYSVLAFDVAQRRRELGIRTALGAAKPRLLRTVVFDGVRLAGVGVVIGLASAFVAGRLGQELLFQVSPGDPVVLGAVGVLLLGVAVAASLVPGFRATRVDPMVALRAE